MKMLKATIILVLGPRNVQLLRGDTGLPWFGYGKSLQGHQSSMTDWGSIAELLARGTLDKVTIQDLQMHRHVERVSIASVCFLTNSRNAMLVEN